MQCYYGLNQAIDGDGSERGEFDQSQLRHVNPPRIVVQDVIKHISQTKIHG